MGAYKDQNGKWFAAARYKNRMVLGAGETRRQPSEFFLKRTKISI